MGSEISFTSLLVRDHLLISVDPKSNIWGPLPESPSLPLPGYQAFTVKVNTVFGLLCHLTPVM